MRYASLVLCHTIESVDDDEKSEDNDDNSDDDANFGANGDI